MAHGHHKFGGVHSMGKQRNHAHRFKVIEKVNGKKMEVCMQPQCNQRHYIA